MRKGWWDSGERKGKQDKEGAELLRMGMR